MVSWIIILLLILVYCRYYVYRKLYELQSIPIVTHGQIGDQLESGDIVLFHNDDFNRASFFQMLVNDTPFTHCGVIYRKGNRVHVLEAHPMGYGKKGKNAGKIVEKSGIELYDFRYRLETYEGQVYVLKLSRKISPERQRRFDQFVKKQISVNIFPSNQKIIHNYMWRCMIGYDIQLPVHCSELVMYVLVKILKLVGDKNVGCATPKELTDLSDQLYRVVN